MIDLFTDAFGSEITQRALIGRPRHGDDDRR